MVVTDLLLSIELRSVHLEATMNQLEQLCSDCLDDDTETLELIRTLLADSNLDVSQLPSLLVLNLTIPS